MPTRSNSRNGDWLLARKRLGAQLPDRTLLALALLFVGGRLVVKRQDGVMGRALRS